MKVSSNASSGNSGPGSWHKTVTPLLMFDFDGVVADSLGVFHGQLAAACRARGFGQLDEREAFLDLFDGNMVSGMRKLGMAPGTVTAILSDLGQGLASAMPRCPPFPGVVRPLRELVRAAPVCIVTSSVSAVVENYLAHHGIDGIVDVLGSDREPSKVLKIQRLKARWPDRRPVYIGDTLGDMIEAREAGAVPVGVAWGWHGPARLQRGNPAAILNTPAELANLAQAGFVTGLAAG